MCEGTLSWSKIPYLVKDLVSCNKCLAFIKQRRLTWFWPSTLRYRYFWFQIFWTSHWKSLHFVSWPYWNTQAPPSITIFFKKIWFIHQTWWKIGENSFIHLFPTNETSYYHLGRNFLHVQMSEQNPSHSLSKHVQFLCYLLNSQLVIMSHHFGHLFHNWTSSSICFWWMDLSLTSLLSWLPLTNKKICVLLMDSFHKVAVTFCKCE